ncbi:MAG: hypothetical protein IT449_14930 [Phycisphaerales bacterium]|nr:hypothetical protein [Phycisphaerales bacterium]
MGRRTRTSSCRHARLADCATTCHEEPIELSIAEAERAWFCFLGEFGYELISWIPYLRYLKQSSGLRLQTVSRPGSKAFYDFSDEHKEAPASYVAGSWGTPQVYARMKARLGGNVLVHPGHDLINKRIIRIGGMEWTTKNIHKRIDEACYAAPNYSFIKAWSPLPDRPIVVINNKYFVQWPDTFDNPVNFFDRPTLLALRDLLVKNGYGVVYNHFTETTAVDQHLMLDDTDIFGGDGATWDMRAEYNCLKRVADRNCRQLALYNAAQFVIGPQGGNLYLPAVCRKSLYILMRAGEYIDYTELARLYRIPVEVFYEPRHLLCWLERFCPSPGDCSILVEASDALLRPAPSVEVERSAKTRLQSGAPILEHHASIQS